MGEDVKLDEPSFHLLEELAGGTEIVCGKTYKANAYSQAMARAILLLLRTSVSHKEGENG